MISKNDKLTHVKSLSEAMENRSFSSNCDKQFNCCTQMNLDELQRLFLFAIIRTSKFRKRKSIKDLNKQVRKFAIKETKKYPVKIWGRAQLHLVNSIQQI